jgi:hypothetical protein
MLLYLSEQDANIHQKSEADVYIFGIKSFLSFILNCGQKFEMVMSLHYVQNRIPIAYVNFYKS